MSYKSHKSNAARVFDHLYDPLYTTSGYKDVWRENRNALTTSAPIHIYPVYRTMFTDLPRRPRNFYMLQQNPLPHFTPFRGSATTTTNSTAPTGKPVLEISGVDRVKFFNIPLTNTKTISLQLDIKQTGQWNQKDCKCISPNSGQMPYKTIGCQTIYREQSAQTKPWMPNAIIGEKRPDTPEIVYVADLLQDDVAGTIPGIYEAEVIERARKRRAWEKSLPAIASIEHWDKRRVVLEAFEWEEWVAREQEIEYCQKLRLGVVEKMMEARTNKMQNDSITRFATTAKRISAEMEQKIKALRTKHQRYLRKLDLEHKKISKKYQSVDVATEHIDRTSNLYGPQKRFGVHPKNRHFMAYKTQFEARLDGLHKMQTKPANLKKFVEPKEDIAKPKEPIKEVVQGLWTDKYLQELYESLKALRFKKPTNQELAKCLVYIKEEDIIVFSTPHASRNTFADQEEYLMAIELQKLIKGRSIQTTIYKGRNNYRQLISELQSTHQLPSLRAMDASNKSTAAEKYVVNRRYAFGQQIRLDALMRADAQVHEVMQHAKGSTMEFVLNLIDKELVRLMDQKKAHALCMLAEKERQRREATEAGRRQRADNRRREHEAIYHSVFVGKHDITTNYLENVIIDCIDTTANTSARHKVRELARQIDMEAENPTSENIVMGVLNRFVLPNVYKRIARDNYLADVHQHIFRDDSISNAGDSSVMIRKFIENVISPRGASPISFSSLDSGENSAHHEALHCINQAIGQVFAPTVSSDEQFKLQTVATGAYDVIDNIIKNIIPSENEPITARSVEQDILDEILTNINDTLWDYARNDNNTIDDEENESNPNDKL